MKLEKGRKVGKEDEDGGREGGRKRERKGEERRERKRKRKGGEKNKNREMNAEQRGASQVVYKDQLTVPTSVFLQSHSILEVILTRGLCCPCQQRPHHHCGCSQC